MRNGSQLKRSSVAGELKSTHCPPSQVFIRVFGVGLTVFSLMGNRVATEITREGSLRSQNRTRAYGTQLTVDMKSMCLLAIVPHTSGSLIQSIV